MEQAILNEELARVRAPGVVNAMAIWWVGPAIMKYGTEEQKKRFIPKILTAEEIWATGYSEPSSGSDMAAAKTRAERQGDYYVVNGQKIWTHARAHLRLVLRPRPHLDRGPEVGRPVAVADGHEVARASRSARSARSTAAASSTRSS